MLNISYRNCSLTLESRNKKPWRFWALPTLNKIRDDVKRLIVEKNFPLNTMRALWRINIEAAEAGDIYLKTGCRGYWNKKTHRAVSEVEYRILTKTALWGQDQDVVPAVDAYLEELIDVIFFIVNSTHEVAPKADLDKVFRKKLAYNFTRPKQYGISPVISISTAREEGRHEFNHPEGCWCGSVH